MKVKDAIKILKDNYNPDDDIFFDVYSRNDLDYLDDDTKAKITDDMMTEIYKIMDNWATTENFTDAVELVLNKEMSA